MWYVSGQVFPATVSQARHRSFIFHAARATNYNSALSPSDVHFVHLISNDAIKLFVLFDKVHSARR